MFLIPWPWPSYKTLTKREFNSKSDVWSFGMTLRKVFSLESNPITTLTLDWSKLVEEFERKIATRNSFRDVPRGRSNFSQFCSSSMVFWLTYLQIKLRIFLSAHWQLMEGRWLTGSSLHPSFESCGVSFGQLFCLNNHTLITFNSL